MKENVQEPSRTATCLTSYRARAEFQSALWRSWRAGTQGHSLPATAQGLTAASIRPSNRTTWPKNPWEQGIQSRPIWREDFVKIIWKVKRDFLFFGLRSRNKKGYQAELSLPRLLEDRMSRQKCHFNWCKCEGVGTLGIKFLLKYTCFWKKKKIELLTQGMQSFWETVLSPIWRVSNATGLSGFPSCHRLAWAHTWPPWPPALGES